MEGKLLSNSLKRGTKAPTKENQTNLQQNASEANRKVQFKNEVDLRILRKGNKQSKSNQALPLKQQIVYKNQ